MNVSNMTNNSNLPADEKESLEYVSPYTIRNELGYAIQIRSDTSSEPITIYDKNKSIFLNTSASNSISYTIPTWTEMNY